ncbi:hypothetical protein [Spirillospora sp. NPDC029432]|uniref:hypothetical protein n=1 Tax=Spirillospora sp. NPDC029432 TaxID=3154599 RepID=UPI003453356C
MTESPPRPADDPADPPADAGRPFVLPPAPPPVAPWWAASSLEPAPPESLADPPATRTDGFPVVQAEPPPAAAAVAPPPPVPPVPAAPEPVPAPVPAAEAVITTGPQPRAAGWTAPQPVQAQPVQPQPAQPQPAQPQPGPTKRGRSKKGLAAGLAVGAGVLAAAVAAGGLALVAGGEDVPVRKVSAAGTAGGLRKDAEPPAASAAYPFIAAGARAAGVEKDAKAGAVYRDPATGAQNVLFLGGTAPVGDPAAFLRKARPSTVIKTAAARPLKGGGRISCGTFAVLAATHLYCAWATENSFGFVAANTPAPDGRVDGLDALTRRMRADLEKTPA